MVLNLSTIKSEERSTYAMLYTSRVECSYRRDKSIKTTRNLGCTAAKQTMARLKK